MASSSPIIEFQKLEPFKSCSEKSLLRLTNDGELLNFGIGHSLSTEKIIPNRVLLILKGKARLLGTHNEQLKSLVVFSPGNLVGLNSLLRAEPCEEVSAAVPLEAWSIPDSLIADLYSEEESFRNWCNRSVFPAEITKLLESILGQSEKSSFGILDILSQIMPLARVNKADEISISNLKDNELAFIASSNTELALNSELKKNQKLPSSNGTFDLRMIILPNNVVNSIKNGKPDSEVKRISPKPKKQEDIIQQEFSSFPSKTNLNLDGTNPQENITLQRGSEPFSEVLACFRMLAQTMDLPFRRDAIEKTIHNALRNGREPSIPILGQIASSMGLLATGTKIPSSFCTRMNVPCLITYDNSVGLVVQSNASGFLIAHPRLGWLNLKPEEVEKEYPDGIEVILVSRTDESQTAKFDLNWFLPAIKRYRSAFTCFSLIFCCPALYTSKPLTHTSNN